MAIRPLDLLDLPKLVRYRSEAVSLDSKRVLTRGNPLGAAGFMSYFNPMRHLYTGVFEENGTTLLGGISQKNGDSFSRLVYLAPASRLNHPGLPSLIEQLCVEAGSWGSMHVLAEPEEESTAFPALRMSGFSVYAWQRIWDVSHIPSNGIPDEKQLSEEISISAVQSLYYQIVPPLLQTVEPLPKTFSGVVCSQSKSCYVNITQGSQGIVLTPLIHPEASDVSAELASLVSRLPDRRDRPVYICVRSYQAWLETAIEDLGGVPSGRQAVMVKHLVHLVKDEQTVRAAQPAGVSVQPSRVTRP
ncbi:MAG: hypothetical protein WCP19_01710 [Chloroflexota bacterium]